MPNLKVAAETLLRPNALCSVGGRTVGNGMGNKPDSSHLDWNARRKGQNSHNINARVPERGSHHAWRWRQTARDEAWTRERNPMQDTMSAKRTVFEIENL